MSTCSLILDTPSGQIWKADLHPATPLPLPEQTSQTDPTQGSGRHHQSMANRHKVHTPLSPGQAQAGPLQAAQLRNSKNTKSRNAQQWKMVQKYIHLIKYSSGTTTPVFEACNIHKFVNAPTIVSREMYRQTRKNCKDTLDY